MTREYDVITLMKRNHCTYFEIDRDHVECLIYQKTEQCIGPCKMMEISIRDLLAKKEKHDQEFIGKVKEAVDDGLKK